MEQKCTCKRKGCKRHGDCDACMEYHKSSSKYPRPACGKQENDTAVEAMKDGVQPLLSWYHHNARSLPWRDEPTPYRVWISEIMLQQTRVEAVKPFFERFMKELPDVAALARVDDDRLMKLWEGLGYYSRARNLKKAANVMLQEYSGEVPSSYEGLLEIPGIGPYTAGAVASIAFGIAVPAVDGNVLRVVARSLACKKDIAEVATKRYMTQLLQEAMPVKDPGDFNQALMELGATVCIPNGSPLCECCPIRETCSARIQKLTETIPVKASKKPRTIEEKTVYVIVDGANAAIRRRQNRGLLAGLWELPNSDGHLKKEQARDALEKMGIHVRSIEELPPSKHIFTHREWNMNAYLIFGEQIEKNNRIIWATSEELKEKYALPSAFRANQKVLFQELKKGTDPEI